MRYLKNILNEEGNEIFVTSIMRPDFSHKYIVNNTDTKEDETLDFSGLSDDIVGVKPYKGTYILNKLSLEEAKIESWLSYKECRFAKDIKSGSGTVHFNSKSGIVFVTNVMLNEELDYSVGFSIGHVVYKSLKNHSPYIDVKNNTVSVYLSGREFIYEITNVPKFNLFVTKTKMLSQS